MKLIMLMIIFAFTLLITTFTESTEIEKNSILIDNLSEDNLAEHSSRIQKRTIFSLLGLKPRYKPIQISLNWRKPNQQRVTKYNTVNTIPSILTIQKNFFFYNGFNVANNQHNPEIYLSTTQKYLTTTENVIENKSAMNIEDMFSKPSMQTTESSFTTTRFVTSTETAPLTQNVVVTKTTQINQITTPTTSKPLTEKPINIITTESTIIKVSDNVNTKSIKGGFTSTSMPQKNEYSELIYDIDPRYKK